MSDWVDRPVLITGATGLVGSRLADSLVALGGQVVCLVRDWVPASPLLSGSLDRRSLVFGDVRDQALLERVLGDYEVEVVFHLAAQTTVTTANRNPVETFDTNVRGTWSALEACRRSPAVRAVVVASSDKAYGEPRELPLLEGSPLAPIHPYDVSKACADLIATSYAATFGVPVAVTRAGNLFGPGDLNWSRIVPGTIRSVLRGQAPVIRSDGSPLRDYLYVDDMVDAFIALADAVSAGRLHGSALNVSYEEPRSVADVVSTILSTMGSDLEPVVRGDAPHEIQDQYLDAGLARRDLGWSPSVGFDGGLHETIQWYREHLGVPV
jgi:CDP-glucose 4,6-dehydratase